jgi:amino acid permease
MPLSSDETRFIEWWEQNRNRQKKLFYQVWLGIPLGIAFALPILINFIAGRYWYKRADSVGASQFNPMILVIALLLIVVFIGVFHKKHSWDQNEQRYLELQARKRKEANLKGENLA